MKTFFDRRVTFFLCSLRRRPSIQFLPTCTTGSTLCVMGGRLCFLGHVCSSYTCTGSSARRYGIWASQGRELSERTNCSDATYTTYISKLFHQPSSSTHFVLFSMEKTQSSISPYMCYRLCALCYRWLAAVPWSRLFLLHVHGLRA